MSPFGIASTVFGLLKSVQSASSSESTSSTRSSLSNTTDSADFSMALRMASMQAQSVNTLIGSVFGKNSVTGTQTASNPLSMLGLSGASTGISGLSPSGRNLSLFDPESGYKMMSIINNRDVNYKAQFADLSEMKTGVSAMQQAAQGLKLDASMDATAIRKKLETFTAQYNEWIKKYDPKVQTGGVLDGTQAAEISLYELEQSIENIFTGAKFGFRGMPALGLTVDQATNLVSLDNGKLDAALATNKDGVVSAVNEFAAHFGRSAELLTSENNFIRNRLANLDRVIDFIYDNKASLQKEFGTGDAASPSSVVAQALALYNKTYRT